jgi:hypothetical protein
MGSFVCVIFIDIVVNELNYIILFHLIISQLLLLLNKIIMLLITN